MLQNQGRLPDNQIRALDEIAASCLQEVDELDARARSIIEAARARYPGGVIPRGQHLPPVPPELPVMQQQRNAALLRGRTRLLAAFGEQEFNRFDSFVMQYYADNSRMRLLR